MTRSGRLAYVNGQFVQEDEAVVSVFDRGFLYGDSIYETVRAESGRILFWAEHERRLRRSCELAAFEITGQEVDLERVVGELLHRNGLQDARIRITISRGPGDPDQLEGFQPTWVVTARPFSPLAEETYAAGVTAITVGVARNAVSSINPEIKSGNFLNNLLARREARLQGAFEGIMCSPEGWLAEGSMTNLFWVRRGILETPGLSVGILHGVTRAKILEIAREAVGEGDATSGTGSVPGAESSPPSPRASDPPRRVDPVGHPIPGLDAVAEVTAFREVLDHASEIFLTSTSLEVLAVTTLDGRRVGEGRRGPVARLLRDRLQALYPR